MRTLRMLALAVAGSVSSTPAALPAATVAIVGVTVIDIADGSRKPDLTVVIEGNRIVRVGHSASTRIPAAARRIDARGKFLIPGLWDMHVHLFNNASRPGTDDHSVHFPLFLANGVTGVRDMWTDPADNRLAHKWKREIDAGRMAGPRIAVASSIIDGLPVNWPNSVGVADAAAARAAVRREKTAGAGFIKVYSRLSRPAYFAIVAEAKRLGIPTAGHVPRSLTAREASEAGQRSIEHLTDMTASCSSAEPEMRTGADNRARSLLAASAYDGAKCRELGSLFARNGTAHTPTLILHAGRLLTPFSNVPEPRLRFVGRAEQRSWEEAVKPSRARDPAVLKRVFDTFGRITSDLSAGGAQILAGTDLGNPHVFAGSSLHDELGLLVQAGLSTQAALAAATVNPVRYLGLERSLGSVEAGKLADLVLLDADPLADIANSRKIAAVVSNGRYFGRRELAAMQDAAAPAARAIP